ncbi:hypothetical protein CW745_13495 [Psychromonas sp. psych-6C06]|uniref:DUF4124 domain-containing protein n=1 Tax=Psychromonas sp. psych-6C06 TaxID=2058089 RepID=UPI000C322EB6|nr:DUF4124 domain-containing protein [Psychromonas sp. psych-6C06]PKF60883.1 hypothetical protein CW745_13495 [Psychromonas sp. psych-6C06]
MKLSALFFSALLYSLSPLVSAADTKIYHWVDENGKIHFSDTAVPGTEQIDVKNNNLLSSGKQASDEPDAIANELSLDDEDTPVVNYQATIISPEDDKPLRSNDGTIDIHVSTEPEKENTHKLQLYLDGKKLGSPQISPTIRAKNIDRGTHQVQVEMLDKNGKVVAKTQVVTVHLQRATVR